MPKGFKGFQKGNQFGKNTAGEKHPRWKGGKLPCCDCGKVVSKFGVKRCHKCYLVWMKKNPPRRYVQPKLKVWRNGYVFIYQPNHPQAIQGRVREHRLVMENMLGRLLKPLEIIHHIDGNKSNNLPNNLLLCENKRKHKEVHTQMEIFVEVLIRKEKVYYNKKGEKFEFMG